jgi:hypothetical protein
MNYDRRSVGQSVLVSSPIWGSRPDINYYFTVTVVFSMSGAPSDRRSGVSFVLVTWTASVKFSKFAAGPRQHSIYLSVFITPGERVATTDSWLVTNSAIYLYNRGTWLRLLLRHSRNTSRDVFCAAATRASAILFAASHSLVAWLPSNCCKQTPYCLQHARHTI